MNAAYIAEPLGSTRVPAEDRPVLSVFSGAGGLDSGFKNAGFRPVLALDINPAAVSTYRRNHPNTAVVRLDLSQASPADIVKLWEFHAAGLKPVGIIGGPPCQGFSLSNLHKTERDPRRSLLRNYANIITAFACRYEIDFFAFENVPNLATGKHKALLEEFANITARAGFDTKTGILNAGTFGVPQHRKRLVAVGINRKLPVAFGKLELNEGSYKETPSIAGKLSSLPEPVFCSRRLQVTDIPHHPNHVAMVPRSAKFRDGTLSQGKNKGLSFKVLDWNAPSYTVAYGHNEIHIHPGCHRRLSVFEAMLLQGFNSSYHLEGTFTEQVQLISDAVPPPFAEGIADAIANALDYQ